VVKEKFIRGKFFVTVKQTINGAYKKLFFRDYKNLKSAFNKYYELEAKYKNVKGIEVSLNNMQVVEPILQLVNNYDYSIDPEIIRYTDAVRQRLPIE
jgi:hypothetical protein